MPSSVADPFVCDFVLGSCGRIRVLDTIEVLDMSYHAEQGHMRDVP